jgi:hypothetical protein
VLHIALTLQYGWHGTAATTISAAGGLGNYYATRIVNVIVPDRVVDKQVFKTDIMALVVYASRLLLDDSLPVVFVLVTVGATVYFGVLLAISQEFRTTVGENLPFDVPLLAAQLR